MFGRPKSMFSIPIYALSAFRNRLSRFITDTYVVAYVCLPSPHIKQEDNKIVCSGTELGPFGLRDRIYGTYFNWFISWNNKKNFVACMKMQKSVKNSL